MCVEGLAPCVEGLVLCRSCSEVQIIVFCASDICLAVWDRVRFNYPISPPGTAKMLNDRLPILTKRALRNSTSQSRYEYRYVASSSEFGVPLVYGTSTLYLRNS